jgi:hypothetical protein
MQNTPLRTVRPELSRLRQVKRSEQGGVMKPNTAKYRIGHGGYVSEFDQFINDFIAAHPEVEQNRRRGWYIWWDHKVDTDDLKPQHDDDVPVESYQYK